ncbi:MAG: MFS transporter [Hyphomonadaceae bacterium]
MAASDPEDRLTRAHWSWALFEWGRNPYVILISIYIFQPYVSAAIIGDPVEGQAIISSWHKLAGIIVAVTAPFLGAIADRTGRRKPLIALVLAIMAPSIFALWWAAPAVQGGMPLAWIGALVTIAGVCFAYTEVLHNSMLPYVAAPRVLARVSGLGLALGNAASVLMLVAVLWFLALPGMVALPGLPSAPLFGLEHARGEPSRITAPFVALWLVIFALPLFVFAPDGRAGGQSMSAAVRDGLTAVLRTLSKLRQHRNVAFFLIARMFYADGKTAVLIFGGVYAAGVMGWGMIEMCVYGVVLSLFAVLGGLIGGELDSALGPKRAVVIEIAATILCLAGMVSMAPSRMLFLPYEGGAVWEAPIMRTAPELAYLGLSCLIAVAITAAFASSRTLMARLSPAGMEGELFGLYALSGAATVWLGPLLVERFTRAFQSQEAGFASIGILLVVGLGLLLAVKPPPKPA